MSSVASENQSLDDTLKDREAVYGRFEDNAEVADRIINALECSTQWGFITPTERIALIHIAAKMSRLVCGDCRDKDGWRDIAGYATRVLESLEKV